MKSGTVGSWIRWGIFGAIAVWTIILCVLSKDVLRVEINNNNEKSIELEKELSDTKRLVKLLQGEKEKLQKLSDEQGYLLKNQGKGKFDSKIQRAKDEILVVADGSSKDEGELYSLEHEIAKRSLDNNIKEIYFYINKFIEEHNSTELSSFGKRAIDQLLALLAESTNFSESIDSAGLWHKRSLDSLTKRIQNRILRLQNPADCKTQKLLVCDLNKGCGFGCQLHHVAYFGKCKSYNSGITGAASWNGINQEERVVRLPIVDGLTNRPPQLPLSFPKQFANEILKHHTNPPAYFISQFIWYLMRNNENMEKAITEAKEKVPFGNGKLKQKFIKI
uniref:Alpha-(1,6)-fucosyltransferase N- and catalytic domain-containing protein n=1 Tax=Panagrolaimus sp. PS1159 TaxID=55785 RepID=A0AC35FRP5_9BILA